MITHEEKSLYNELIDLRNRLKDSDEIYEEDHMLLDRVLDFMESLEGKQQEEDVFVNAMIYKELELSVLIKKQTELLQIYRQFYNGYLNPKDQEKRQILEKELREMK